MCAIKSFLHFQELFFRSFSQALYHQYMLCYEGETLNVHSLVNATPLQELNVEVRSTRHLSVHNLKKKRETKRMKWVRLSLCVIPLWHLTDLCVMMVQRTVAIRACNIVGLVTGYQIFI